MTIISVALTTRGGKTLFARQYIDITRLRLEGLLASFPKLLSSSSKNSYTFLDTEHLRYVFQPIEDLYLLILTTKSSNILSSLKTLQLLNQLLTTAYFPEIPNSEIMMNQNNVSKLFSLIYNFDEVISPKLGVYETLTKENIAKFLEMESHEERLFEMLRQSKEDDAKLEMTRKAKEIKNIQSFSKMEGFGNDAKSDFQFGGGATSDKFDSQPITSKFEVYEPEKKEKKVESASLKIGKKIGLSLGKSKLKKADEELADLFKEEGIKIDQKSTPELKIAPKPVKSCKLEFSHIEKLSVVALSDGSIQDFTLKGQVGLTAHHNDAKQVVSRFQSTSSAFKMLYSPKLDKPALAQNTFKLRQVGSKLRDFPNGQIFGLASYKSVDDAFLPVKIVYWPEINGSVVSVSVELLYNRDIPLEHVTISMPLPQMHKGELEVQSCENGAWSMDQSAGCIVWTIENLRYEEKRNNLLEFEFTLASGVREEQLFPVVVDMKSNELLNKMEFTADDMDSDDVAINRCLLVDSYHIIQS